MYQEKDIICKAKIKYNKKWFLIKTFLINSLIVIFLRSYIVLSAFDVWDDRLNYITPLFGWQEYVSCTDYFRKYFFLFRVPIIKDNYYDKTILPGGIIILIASILLITMLPLIIYHIKKCHIKCYSLLLTQDCIYGFKKTLFSSKVVKIALENIDDIFSYSGFRDSIKKCETIYILYDKNKEIEFEHLCNAEKFVETAKSQAKFLVRF